MSKLVGKYIDDIYVRDSGTGDGSTTAFALSTTPHTVKNVQVFLNGLLQRRVADYDISGTTLTFTSAPANAQEIDIYYIGK